jgi:hypothetical protein
MPSTNEFSPLKQVYGGRGWRGEYLSMCFTPCFENIYMCM